MSCECVMCEFCGGKGFYYVDFAGRYIGSRHDDMDQQEPCEYCSGGIVETCYECMGANDDAD